MASFDLLKNNMHGIFFKDSYSFFKKELIESGYITDNWSIGPNKIDRQIKKDSERSTNYIINGIEFTSENYIKMYPNKSNKDIQQQKYKDISTFIEELSLKPYKLLILKYNMVQSIEASANELILTLLKNVDNSIITITRTKEILFNIQIVNSNIINIVTIEYVIKDPYANIANSITMKIVVNIYINYNENKVILTINEINLISNLNSYYSKKRNVYNKLLYIKKNIDNKKNIDKTKFIDYKKTIDNKFYKIINLPLNIIIDFSFSNNGIDIINKILSNKILSNKIVNNSKLDKWNYKINNTQIDDIRDILTDGMFGNTTSPNTISANTTSPNTISANTTSPNTISANTTSPNSILHKLIIFLFSSYEIYISLNSISQEIFKNYKQTFLNFNKIKNNKMNNEINYEIIENNIESSCPFILKFTDNKKEKNFFNLQNRGIFITEYYFDIIYKDSNNEIIVGQIYTYNIANFNDNSYNMYYHIKTIHIRNIIKLKLKNNDVLFNETLDNIVDMYYSIVKIKLNEILSKIEISQILERNKLNNFLRNITNTLPIRSPIHLQQNNNSKESDFLLISFNEDKKSYNYNDCLPMMIKILQEKPKVIVLCTQDSSDTFLNIVGLQDSGFLPASSYQKNFEHIIRSLNYELIKDKSCALNDSSSTQISSVNSSFERFRGTCRRLIKNTSLSFGKLRSKAQNLPKIRTKIYFNKQFLESMKNEPIILYAKYDNYRTTLIKCNLFKIAILNCNLFNSIKNVNHRSVIFQQMISESKLIELSDTHDIFLCGDINFKFTKSMNYNEFYNQFASYKNNASSFYGKLLHSSEELGRHLTSEYYMGNSKNEKNANSKLLGQNFLKKSLPATSNKSKNTRNTRNARNTNINEVYLNIDRILYALKNDTSMNVNNINFNIHFSPDKSSHKMMSLTCDFYSNINITNKHIAEKVE